MQPGHNQTASSIRNIIRAPPSHFQKVKDTVSTVPLIHGYDQTMLSSFDYPGIQNAQQMLVLIAAEPQVQVFEIHISGLFRGYSMP